MKKLEFISQFQKLVEGDDATQQAEKTYEQVKSALTSHISFFEGETIDLSEQVDAAKEALDNAKFNAGKVIKNKDGRKNYIENLIQAKNNLISAESKKESHLKKIEFLKEQLKKLE